MSGGTDRYTGRVDLSYLESLERWASEADKGDDTYRLSISTRTIRRRHSRKELAERRAEMPLRDVAVLRSLRSLRLATTGHLQTLHFHDHASTETGRRVARRVLKRLIDQRLTVRLQRRIGGIRAGSSGHIWALSPIGHRLLGETIRKRTYEPSLHHVQHTLAITDLVVALSEAKRSHTIEELEIETEPDCWRKADSGTGSTLKPDLYTRLGFAAIELSWFIEIDRDTESATALRRKIAAYDTYWRTGTEQRQQGVFPRTLWIAPDRHRAAFITDVIDASGIEPQLFAVTTTAEAIEVITKTESDRQP